MFALKLTKIGNSTGVRLPKELMQEMGVEEGQTVYFVKTPDGYLVTASDPAFGDFLKVAEKGMRKYRNALRELSK